MLPSLAATVPTNLPVTRARLVGREQEMETIRTLLLRDDVSLVTLTGLGGSGKTTLGLYSANALLETFSGGVFFINLAPLTDHHLILPTIAQILNVQEEPEEPLQESITGFLRGRSALLLIDNFEHLLDGAPDISNLLQMNPLLKILVTSREALRLQNEQVVLIRPLPEKDAVELFTQRVQSLRTDFLLTDENREIVSEICRKLDGLPLAIELAAMRTKMFSLQNLLARFQSEHGTNSPLLTTLTSGARDLPPRQQALRETIAWSYGLLSDPEQKTLRAASLFRSACGFEALVFTAGIHKDSALEVVSSLVDKHLLQPSYEQDDRFSILESIREFAMEQVMQLGEFKELGKNFIDWFLLFSKQVDDGLKTGQQTEWFKRVENDYPNILLAIDWALADGAGSQTWKAGLATLDHMHRYWMLRMHFHHAEPYITRARASLEAYDQDHVLDEETMKLKADIYSLAGSISWGNTNYLEAVQHHEKAYRLYSELKYDQGIAIALNNWGANLFNLGNIQAAIEKAEKSLLLYRQLGDSSGEMQQLHNMGVTFQYFDRFDEAFSAFESGLLIARQTNDEYFQAALHHNISHLKERIGDYKGAILDSQECLRIIEHMGNSYLFAWSQVVLGLANIRMGNVEKSIQAFFDGLVDLTNFTQIELKLEFLNMAACILAYQGKNRETMQMIHFIENMNAKHNQLVIPVDAANFQKLKEKASHGLDAQAIAEISLKARDFDFESMLEFAAQNLKSSDFASKPVVDSSLTLREREVLILLAQGMTNEQISKELVVVIKTVEKHVANILMKLGLKNRTEAAAWAIEKKLVK